MEKQEAIKIIDQVLASFKGTRQEHQIILQAWQEILKEEKNGQVRQDKTNE